MKKALNAYKTNSTASSIAYANPHQLIEMLLTATIDNLSKAKGCIGRGEIELKSNHLLKAFDISEALKSSLSDDKSEMSSNLSNLYDFSMESILKVNINSDLDLLDSVVDVIKSIREGWKSIPQNLRGEKSDGIINSSIADSHRK
jgi:flagellar protein FliS